jgi:hypothetical protein
VPKSISSTASSPRQGREIGCPAPTHIKPIEVVKRVEHGQIPAEPEDLYFDLSLDRLESGSLKRLESSGFSHHSGL